MGEAWTLAALKEYVDARLAEAKTAVGLAREANDARLELLNEFRRQSSDRDATFARLEDLAGVKERLDRILVDHVQRREFEDLKTAVGDKASAEDVRMIRDDSIQGRGRRTAAVAAVAVVLFALSLLFGLVLKNGLTSGDVSNQISREAPWLADRTSIEHRLDGLEAQQQALRLQVAQINAQIRFFCTTRVKAGLPGC